MVPANTPDGNGRVLSTIPGGRWGYMQGTSMASPHAAGVVALIRSTHPDWSADEVVAALERQADRLPCPPNPYDPTGDGAFLATCQGAGTSMPSSPARRRHGRSHCRRPPGERRAGEP
jgi:subtilisin family serine protease